MQAIGRILALITVLAALAGAALPARADPRAADGQATLALTAALTGETTPLAGGVRWRIFSARTEEDGSHALIVESNLASPTLTLPPGEYVVHASFGLASAARRLTLGAETHSEKLTIAAGGLKIGGVLGAQPIDPSKLSLAIFVPVGRNLQGKLVYARARAGDVVGLPEGSYPHRLDLSRHGGRPVSRRRPQAGAGKPGAPTQAAIPSNSIVNADIKVASGKLTDVTLRHRCATLTLKLVNKAGGEALANTTFTVLTPGGDVDPRTDGGVPVAGARRGRIRRRRPPRRQDLPGDLPGRHGQGPATWKSSRRRRAPGTRARKFGRTPPRPAPGMRRTERVQEPARSRRP